MEKQGSERIRGKQDHLLNLISERGPLDVPLVRGKGKVSQLREEKEEQEQETETVTGTGWSREKRRGRRET